MSIPVEQEDEIWTEFYPKEDCIFCGCETVYWIPLPINRPCCPQCSVINEPSDIPKAKYNYGMDKS